MINIRGENPYQIHSRIHANPANWPFHGTAPTILRNHLFIHHSSSLEYPDRKMYYNLYQHIPFPIFARTNRQT